MNFPPQRDKQQFYKLYYIIAGIYKIYTYIYYIRASRVGAKNIRKPIKPKTKK